MLEIEDETEPVVVPLTLTVALSPVNVGVTLNAVPVNVGADSNDAVALVIAFASSVTTLNVRTSLANEADNDALFKNELVSDETLILGFETVPAGVCDIALMLPLGLKVPVEVIDAPVNEDEIALGIPLTVCVWVSAFVLSAALIKPATEVVAVGIVV